ncbi:homoserine kinase [Piscinibacter sakaiensis]|uniref:Homoserine kinase n=1 Tax=Piscinibacter sakaiensis TaxID=1547922 RepID=A0A0K8P7E9_PISS1|nr:homoserine kinase [Piscinibacter sakaiensis]GAP38444.1 homoserine kinase [Piscinibacter sakaiensis]
MAVFTEVPFDTARRLIERLDIGTLTTLEGAAGGIENTNYFADTDRGRYVLTVFERLGFEQLPFYLGLMKHLAQRGIPVPDPQADAEGRILLELLGKPAAVVNRLPGRHREAPDRAHAEAVAAMLARMHLAGADFPLRQPNLRGLAWWAETVPVVRPFLDPAQRALIDAELAFQQQLAASAAYGALPAGPIHADLFRDNVMFTDADGEDRLGGFFDFYFAGVDRWLFDIAVCLNDWCIDLDTGALVEARAQAFVAAYDAVRPLQANELRLLPALMRAGALRFWISRLWDLHLPRDARMLAPHDPTHFERVLRQRVAQPWHYERS